MTDKSLYTVHWENPGANDPWCDEDHLFLKSLAHIQPDDPRVVCALCRWIRTRERSRYDRSIDLPTCLHEHQTVEVVKGRKLCADCATRWQNAALKKEKYQVCTHLTARWEWNSTDKKGNPITVSVKKYDHIVSPMMLHHCRDFQPVDNLP